MEKNETKQKKLDEEKWIASEKANEDMSGAMYYCDYCEKQRSLFVCGSTQEEREQKALCAKAYNRSKRRKMF
jgi:hypothetical protein